MIELMRRWSRRAKTINSDSALILLVAILTLLLDLSTLQWAINGSNSPYTTDVGEIQNALPRWGTLHFTGYPLYTLTGSALVSLFRAFGIPPSAGSSLVSALWGALAISLLARLALDLGVPRWAALFGSLVGAVSLSFWVDGSLAEVHTMTVALTMAGLLFALRYRRSGARRDLLWLTLAFTQGVAHQRAIGFIAPALVVLLLPRWREMLKNILPILGVAALAPLTYLYLPLRAWQGAEWSFGQVGTWRGFWAMLLDVKAQRIVTWPEGLAGWWERGKIVLQALAADQPLPLSALGLAGLLLPAARRKVALSLGLTLAWLAYLGVSLIIWEGRVSDAFLAIKLPVVFLGALGLALLAGEVMRRAWVGHVAAPLALAVLSLALALVNRPQVLAITRDRSIEQVVATVAQADLPTDRPCTLAVPWGDDYWALSYAQAYRGELAGLRLVDHNADLAAIVGRGDHLLTLAQTFYVYPLSWWEERLGRIYLSSAGAGVVEVRTTPRQLDAPLPSGPTLDLENGVRVLSAHLSSGGELTRTLTIYWQATHPTEDDYAVAVHILAKNPPAGPEDILAQADRSHPVEGFYPTTCWRPGEVVRDDYLLSIPPGARPAWVRLAMYRQDSPGHFLNTSWLVLPW
jgi:hypothetical protein